VVQILPTKRTNDDMKLDEKKCKYCYGKRFYTVICVKSAADDFGGEGYDGVPKIYKIACSKCNRNNRRTIKGVKGAWWNV
jgi:hypothetical protein